MVVVVNTANIELLCILLNYQYNHFTSNSLGLLIMFKNNLVLQKKIYYIIIDEHEVFGISVILVHLYSEI